MVIPVFASIHPDVSDFGLLDCEGVGQVIQDFEVPVEIGQLLIVNLLGEGVVAQLEILLLRLVDHRGHTYDVIPVAGSVQSLSRKLLRIYVNIEVAELIVFGGVSKREQVSALGLHRAGIDARDAHGALLHLQLLDA